MASAPTAAPPHDEHAHWVPRINPVIIALTVMLATFMEVLDTSIANVALPHIAGNLSAGLDESTWVLTTYMVSNAIVLPLTGWFSTLFGRKNFYMTCVVLFTLSSLACGLAPNLKMLLVFRVLQGIGGGALQPISQAILYESFPKSKQGMAMAIYGMGVVLAPIVGPTLGGWITDNFSWRWIFLINIPVGVLSIALTTLNVDDPPYLERKKLGSLKIDYIGLGLLSIGLAALQIMLDKGERDDWFDSHFIMVMAVLAVAGILGAIYWECTHDDPVVDFKLLRNLNFFIANVMMFMIGAVLYGSTMILPLFLQSLMGYTATKSGEVLSPGGMVTLIAMPIAGYLVAKVNLRWLLNIGLVSGALALFYMAGYNLQTPFWTAVHGRVFQSAGLAFLFVPINTAAFAYIARKNTNNASGIINLSRNIGGSVGIALCSTAITQQAQVHQNILAGHLSALRPEYFWQFNQVKAMLFMKGASLPVAEQQANAMYYGILRMQSSMLAYVDVFRWMGWSFLALIPLTFLLKSRKISSKTNMPVH